ncbi:TraM recognition domain-containing protein [Streptacidiphilus anmyonensis]|uniref:TraM recognition domain-containing protein n=1 Tax=Streptacidiphilus anmyonensis TaxID=405782 RepID=UPI0006940D21|nr:TraM recognition domain-containing protein [Streptacidiphilus anmyonensis]
MSSSPSPSGPRQPQQPPSQPRRWQQPGPASGQPQPQPQQRPDRGIPDGLIVGLLAVLLGTTALVWGATELGGLATHGRFPRPLPFLSTAGAIRHLATDPNDLAGAWPGTPTASLPSAAAFWLTFFALLALVLLLLLSAATARAKRRAAHDTRRRAQAEAEAGGAAGGAAVAASGEGAVGAGGVGVGGVGAGAVGDAGTPVGPPGQRRGPTPTDQHTTVPVGRTPFGPVAPGPGVAASGVPGAGVPMAPGVPGPAPSPGGSASSTPSSSTATSPTWPDRAGSFDRGPFDAGFTDAFPPGQTDAAPSAWGAAGPHGTPGDPPPPSHRAGPAWPDAASAQGATPDAAAPWTSSRSGMVTGAASDGRVIPQGTGGWSHDAPQHPGLPTVTDPGTGFPAGRADALPAQGAAVPTPGVGVGVPRPSGSTAAGWAQRGTAGDGYGVLPFALPETGTLCVFAPEAGAAGRHALMSAAVADAASAPLVVVTADPELWDGRPPHRRAVRFDPQQLTDDDPDSPRGRWAPHTACTEPVVATARARALLLPTVRPVAGAEEQSVRRLAETLLRCWLRAAALDGRPFRHVVRWAGTGSTGSGSTAGRQEAVAVLQSGATPVDVASGEEAWAGQLQSALLQPAPALGAALGRIRAALGAATELHVLAACTPQSPTAALDPAGLLEDGAAGSLYVLGHAGDGRLREPGSSSAPAVHSAMPLLSALVDDVVQRAWNTAEKARNAVAAPAPVFVLDDIAAVAPFPTLPQLMTDGATRGLRAVTLLRSPEQARARWGERAVHSLWTNADHCALLGPLSPAPLAALLASLGAAEHSGQQALGPDELLVLAGRHRTAPPQRFRIGPVRG